MEVDEKRYVHHELGLRLKPPAAILYYVDTAAKKYRRRLMPLRGFQSNSVITKYVSDMKERHQPYLSGVPDVSLMKLLRILQEMLRGKDLKASAQLVEQEFAVDPEEDLNKVDTLTLKVKKQIMDETFLKNQKKPGDPDFEYDKEVDFDTENADESCGWDTSDAEAAE